VSKNNPSRVDCFVVDEFFSSAMMKVNDCRDEG